MREFLLNCQKKIEIKATAFLKNELYLNLPAVAFHALLSSDKFFVDKEIDVFKAIVKWMEKNPDGDKQLVLSAFRLSLITTE